MSYSLRLASTSDLPELLRWRNDPITRYFREDDRIINADEHRAWFQRRQNSSDKIFVLTLDGIPVGNSCLDYSDDGCEIGWIIAPEHRRNGLATAMVKLVISEAIPTDVHKWAKTRDDNTASICVAKACGFRFTNKDGRMLYFVLPQLELDKHVAEERRLHVVVGGSASCRGC